MVVGRAVLPACDSRARSGPHKCLRRAKAAGGKRSASQGADDFGCGDPAWLSRVIARLYRLERARLFAVLHFRQACVDSVDRRGLRGLPHSAQRSLAHRYNRDVVRAASASLRLLQPRKRVVDRSHRREPAVLRMGLCGEHHSCGRLANSDKSLAVASCLLDGHRRRSGVLRFASLLSFSLVNIVLSVRGR